MTVIGADKVMRKLSKLERRVKDQVDAANRKSGEELVRTAKVLIPMGADVEKDGRERDKITGTQNPDGSYLVDFGPKSKVIEGDRGPRPFVNPALKVLRKKHGARVRRAVNKAVKESFSG
ncbi:HK97 gp10 family phage protein [Salipiger sp. H15]|uniref:HK97 gp10 family phage protein n=1 Tax=Alloyangia sp. H15 TaxID=3029062 RepID=A0AAU8API0_9RHOB